MPPRTKRTNNRLDNFLQTGSDMSRRISDYAGTVYLRGPEPLPKDLQRDIRIRASRDPKWRDAVPVGTAMRIDTGDLERMETRNKRGQLHGAPAVTVRYLDGSPRKEEYWKNGKRHHDDGPAYVEYHDNGDVMTEIWFENDLFVSPKKMLTRGLGHPYNFLRFDYNGFPRIWATIVNKKAIPRGPKKGFVSIAGLQQLTRRPFAISNPIGGQPSYILRTPEYDTYKHTDSSGALHKDKGPAVVKVSADGKDIGEGEYWIHGKKSKAAKWQHLNSLLQKEDSPGTGPVWRYTRGKKKLVPRPGSKRSSPKKK